jgi:UDP-N-acetylglucosamine 1-carboxyvinyltransferase
VPKFIVHGGQPLNGVIRPTGNKNAALPMIAATLLTDEDVFLENVPRIKDVLTLLSLLEVLGAETEWTGPSEVRVRAANVGETQLDAGQAARIRASILLAGPMVARTGGMQLPPPGGDVIGRRRVDTHFLALRKLGAEVVEDPDFFGLRAEGGLKGADMFLDEPSVTATENAVMAASLAKGTTRIRNAAAEPHVQDLCHMLNGLGAQISGIGTNTLSIKGVSSLHRGEHTILSDHMEVGSFIGLAAVTGGELRIRKAVPEHMRMSRLVFNKLGVEVRVDGDAIVVPGGQDLKVAYDVHEAVPKIDDGIWPAFPSDLMSIALVTATQSEGTVLIFEKMFENRLFFVDRLISMGARIVLCDPHRAVVVGKVKLRGEDVSSPDIRAGMALLQAALCAKGESTIFNVGQIDRGYQAIEKRLEALGAKIRRVND